MYLKIGSVEIVSDSSTGANDRLLAVEKLQDGIELHILEVCVVTVCYKRIETHEQARKASNTTTSRQDKVP